MPKEFALRPFRFFGKMFGICRLITANINFKLNCLAAMGIGIYRNTDREEKADGHKRAANLVCDDDGTVKVMEKERLQVAVCYAMDGILYPFLQKYFSEGIALEAVKG